MKERFTYTGGAYQAMLSLETYLKRCGLEPGLVTC